MSNSQTTVFMDHIQEYATQYFVDLEPSQIEVQFEEARERTNSILYKFTLGDKVQSYSVLVKVPLYRGLPASETQGVSYYKPRLFPRTEPRDMHRLEYAALSTIYEYFNNLDEKHLGAIRVLDYLPEHHAILMEESRDPSLRQLFFETSRLHIAFKPRKLDLPFQNTGKWLHLYHGMSKEDDVKIRHAYRYEYIEAVDNLTGFLAMASGDKAFFQKTASMLEIGALKILPDLLPLGLGHGDFAMRNILVGPGARVSVIDTFAKWRTPIYEDIGFFLTALKMSGPQLISQGTAFTLDKLVVYEHAFLKGYYDQNPIPYSAIRLYEILAMLDKWASVITHHQGRKFNVFGEVKVTLISRYLKRSIEYLCKEINES